MFLAFSTTLTAVGQAAKLPGVDTAMRDMIAKHEIAGAVTAVVTRDAVLHLDAAGFADLAAKRPMTLDTLFWIASMSKAVTAAAVLMLQDDGMAHLLRR